MKPRLLLIVLLSSATLAPARGEDIATTVGREYKGVTISRTEPDGIVIMHSAGIIKIPFTELSPELQKKYGYNPQAAAAFHAQVENAAAERERSVAEAQEKQRQPNLPGTQRPP